MLGRLAAPPASVGCIDLLALESFGDKLQLIDLKAPDAVARTASLRDFIRGALHSSDESLAEKFWAGEDIVQLVRARAWVVEQLLLLAWKCLVPFSEKISLIAVGGYGRGELHPHSDVDLMILLDDQIDEDGGAGFPREEIECYVQLLWDAGFYLGHSVRTLGQCIDEARNDVVTLTTIMESRLLAGSKRLLDAMMEQTSSTAMWPGSEFFEAKFEEQQLRHQRYHETAYNLEPNIKEGPGGLRDIQMISWVAKRHWGARTLHGLVENGVISESEHRDLAGGQRFLWRVRYALHLLAGRAEDRLLFDYQREIAARFGFEDGENNLAVEQFMQLYYRTVMRLERLNESLLQLYREELLFTRHDETIPLTRDFRSRHNFLETVDDAVFVRRPAALMQMFVLLARREELRGITAATIRMIRDHLYLVNDEFRNDSEVNGYFLELLRQPEGVYTQLRRLNRYGLLAAYIPAFGNIVGRMQYDLFHVYTVDQHILFVVRNLRRFAYGKYKEIFPHARSVFKRIAKPELLYLAAIFHDIAKGRGGDHSELGAVEAREFCEKLEIDRSEREMIVWLVEQHLLMSQTSQRKDISDPANIQNFAEVVGNTRYLDHLYLLTVADIAGTSPKLWNSWKNGLLWDLYLAAGHALRRGLDNPLKRATRVRETRSTALSHLLLQGVDSDAIGKLWNTLPEAVFWRLSPDQLEWATRTTLELEDREYQVAVRGVQPHGVSELLVCVPDHDGLFATIASVLDEMGMDVLSARILTTDDARSFDLFQLMDQHSNVLNDEDARELEQRLQVALKKRGLRSPVRRTMPRRLKHFTSRPRVHFTQDPDRVGTVMHLHCSDQPGLLSAVSAALFKAGVQVHNARIATLGDRVEDTFLISDSEHHPLTEEACEALAGSIRERLEAGNPT
jgi:[protein-PII] uridylyltransferase